mmetsp:Transcript_20147/g.35791  ORF Transcript_20147/g.35791 Transcript_20147/m.35791 type:complete len:209 (-) Transcript_20147:1847-2473(-)
MESVRRWPCNLPHFHPSIPKPCAADLFHTGCCNLSRNPFSICSPRCHCRAFWLPVQRSGAGSQSNFQWRIGRISLSHLTRNCSNTLPSHWSPRNSHRIGCRLVWQLEFACWPRKIPDRRCHTPRGGFASLCRIPWNKGSSRELSTCTRLCCYSPFSPQADPCASRKLAPRHWSTTHHATDAPDRKLSRTHPIHQLHMRSGCKWSMASP